MNAIPLATGYPRKGLATETRTLGRRFLPAHQGIEVTDLIVAALTQHLGATLKTTNLKHFPMFTGLKAP